MVIKINDRQLIDFNQPKVMGIINCTPDSFYAKSRAQNEKDIAKVVEKICLDGTDIIDIGAASTRPGAETTYPDLEIERLSKVIKTVVKYSNGIPISIDTVHQKVANYAVDNGVNIVNDISAGNDDPKMLPWICKHKIPYIMMHKKGSPKNMQNNTGYGHILTDILSYFKKKIAILQGSNHHDVIVDIGFGFSKTVEQNYFLLKNLDCFKILGLPLLVGISRKSMVYKILNIKPEQALNGSTILHLLALQNGANILRIHDVKEAKQVIKLYDFYKNINV